MLELFRGQTYPPADYARKLHPKLLSLCEKYNLPIRVSRWIPSDYRKWNYRISEILLNKEYLDALKTGKSNKSMMWAGLNLNNLDESIIEVFKRGELSSLPNFNKQVIDLVVPYLEKSKSLKQKTGIDHFL
jgi:hypothetical protein